MPDTLRIANIRFVPARLDERSRGLRGWVSLDIGDALHLDGIAVRRALDGRMYLSFPVQRDDRGREHSLVRPLTQDARDAIESQVIDELRRRGHVP